MKLTHGVFVALVLSMLLSAPYIIVLGLYGTFFTISMMDTTIDGEFYHYHPRQVKKTKHGYTFEVVSKDGDIFTYPNFFPRERQAVARMAFICKHPQPLGVFL